MNANFSTLFERSRYCGWNRLALLDKADKEQLQYQHERFAASIMGFALDHDSKFRRHFLKAICGLAHGVNDPTWEVSVEPEKWGDLVLRNKALSTLIVVEFKIDCPLASHQNPSKRSFNLPPMLGSRPGYGWAIRRCGANERFSFSKQ